jgi:hypothetical protein
VGSAEDARRCLALAPDDARAAAVLAGHLEPPPGSDFSGAIRLLGSRSPEACVPRGGSAAIEWTWETEDGFSPGEDVWVFVHADGPGLSLGADHRAGGRPTDSLQPGERFPDRIAIDVPASAPPGRYALHLGFYDPATGLRLAVRGQPAHVAFVEAGAFEVCP